MTRHVSPSRQRYEAENPVVSTRLPLEVLHELEVAAADRGVSIAAFLRSILTEETDWSARALEAERVVDSMEQNAGHLAEKSEDLQRQVRQLGSEVTRLSKLEQQARAQIVTSKRQAANEAARASSLEHQLADAAGPGGRFLQCPSCGHPWHKHHRADEDRTWRCPMFFTIVR